MPIRIHRELYTFSFLDICTANSDYINRLDIDLAILDLLESVGGMAPPSVDYRKQWEGDVKLHAPGYLALEAFAQGGEYDLRNLTAPIC